MSRDVSNFEIEVKVTIKTKLPLFVQYLIIIGYFLLSVESSASAIRTDPQLIIILSERAVIMFENEKVMLFIGESSKNGITLVQATSELAQLEIAQQVVKLQVVPKFK